MVWRRFSAERACSSGVGDGRVGCGFAVEDADSLFVRGYLGFGGHDPGVDADDRRLGGHDPGVDADDSRFGCHDPGVDLGPWQAFDASGISDRSGLGMAVPLFVDTQIQG